MLIGIDANEANLTQYRLGINQYAFFLLQALYSLSSSHHFVIYLKSPPVRDLPPARPGWSYRVIPFKKLWTQTRLPFDLYTHRPRPDVFLSLTHYAPRWCPVPNVVSVMDLGFLKFPHQFTAHDFNQLKHWTEYSVKKATRVIAISEHTKKDILAIYHRLPFEVTVTHLGYNSTLFRPVSDLSLLARYRISPPYFIFVGSLKPSKNLENLIRAFALFNRPDHRLVIVGKKAWLYDRIFSLVDQLGLTSKVIFTDFVPDRDLPALLTHSQAFVLPSFYEGFGIPVLEAMACHTPVIVSRVASLPEVAGAAGIYISDPASPADIAAGLSAASGHQRTRFVNLGENRVKLFSWEKTARTTLELLEQIVPSSA